MNCYIKKIRLVVGRYKMDPDPDESHHPGTEDLVWSKEVEKSVKGVKPEAKYTKFSETARTFISTEKQCALFCGGKKCKYCSPNHWPKEDMAINGLYSNWVTENILAMARPSNHAIKNAGIKSIINLQTPGEHAECGYGLDKNGFSYDTQQFMEKEIYFYNFGWPDYGVASLSRTGLIIASYLVFTNRISGEDAVHYVRSQRRGSIQTRAQMQCIKEFELYLKPFRIVFASKAPDSHEFTLQQFLNRQKHILHGYEGRRLKHVPKVVYVTCERILELAFKSNALSKFRKELVQSESLGELEQEVPNAFRNQPRSTNLLNLPRNESMTSFNTEEKSPMHKPRKGIVKARSLSLEDLPDHKLKSVLVDDGEESDSSCTSRPSIVLSPSVDDDEDIGLYIPRRRVSRSPSPLPHCINEDEIDETPSFRMGGDNDSPEPDDCLSYRRKDMTAAEALGATDCDEESLDIADRIEERLNQTDKAWEDLATETNPLAVSQVLWDWLDQLKEPVLRIQDLKIMLQHVDDPETGLQKLEKGTRYTIEYILKVIAKLKPLDGDLETTILEKLISHLTHQYVMNIQEMQMLNPNSWAMSTRLSDQSSDSRDHWT
ncbi:hypothetical protein KUTeg_020448 [Tegillarca granosa]|uniref:Tyrosine specific protein phosphatases domain-containing protein n=1 Tax=Tegillarca granosa TaxID=220873 RepID=A0ABQ9E7X0_TEGGR|nr:hypothetical protein KUTeg_020448 [Tegillarca granosa]